LRNISTRCHMVDTMFCIGLFAQHQHALPHGRHRSLHRTLCATSARVATWATRHSASASLRNDSTRCHMVDTTFCIGLLAQHQHALPHGRHDILHRPLCATSARVATWATRHSASASLRNIRTRYHMGDTMFCIGLFAQRPHALPHGRHDILHRPLCAMTARVATWATPHRYHFATWQHGRHLFLHLSHVYQPCSMVIWAIRKKKQNRSFQKKNCLLSFAKEK
jgi:hypothetical protein